jgi:hypothetical protein
MIENVMHSLGGVEMFGIISICIFFAFFAGMLIWAACLKQPYLKSMRELPLDGEVPPPAATAATSNLENRHE